MSGKTSDTSERKLKSAAEFWREYYRQDPNFPPSEAACKFAEAYADSRVKEVISPTPPPGEADPLSPLLDMRVVEGLSEELRKVRAEGEAVPEQVMCNWRQDGNPPFNCKLPADHSGNHSAERSTEPAPVVSTAAPEPSKRDRAIPRTVSLVTQTDIANLRFYADMADENDWDTLQIASNVVSQTLREIADRMATPKPIGDVEAVARKIAEMIANDVCNLTWERVNYFIPPIAAILSPFFAPAGPAGLCPKCKSDTFYIECNRCDYDFMGNVFDVFKSFEAQPPCSECATLKKVLDLVATDELFIQPADGGGWVFWVNVNDMFYPAADSEGIDLPEIPAVWNAWKEKGWPGVVRWVQEKRGGLKLRNSREEKILNIENLRTECATLRKERDELERFYKTHLKHWQDRAEAAEAQLSTAQVTIEEVKPDQAPDYFSVQVNGIQIYRFAYLFEAELLADKVRAALAPTPEVAPKE